MQIKSKQRVVEHGEVFTNMREVNAMLDMTDSEADYIAHEERRVLEPACGEGAFLQEILRRRLEKLAAAYKAGQTDYEFHALIALGSLYGIDILPDNAALCRENLLELFTQGYKNLFKKKAKPQYIDAARFILERNIICGDAQTMTVCDAAGEAKQDIAFSEWQPMPSYQINRLDYVFRHLLAGSPMETGTLFASDTGADLIMPQPKGQECRHYLSWGRDIAAAEAMERQPAQRELFNE